MDPLSVTASVVGLLAAAAQFIPQLYNLSAAIKDAPRIAQAAVSELNDITHVLVQLQRYIDGKSQASVQRLSLITVESIAASLTGCVITYSELDAVLKSLRAGEGMRAWDRAVWMVKKDSVNAIIGRLQNHKSSFSLMLNIIQCSSMTEAERSMDNLCDQVAQLLRSNQELSMRLRNLEDGYSVRGKRGSVTETPTVTGADPPTVFADSPPASISSTSGAADNPGRVSSDTQQGIPHDSAFEELLHRSRVYRNAQRRHSQSSLTDDGRSTLAISICSSLTLGEVSKISVYALPVYASEISNPESYTFGIAVTATRPALKGVELSGPGPVAPNRLQKDTDASTRKNLKEWWTSFQRRQAPSVQPTNDPPAPIFGVPITKSIRYANVAISLQNEQGEKFIYGYVPIVVAKCGVYLKEKGRVVENIFDLSGNPNRLRQLREVFDNPPRYGKGLDWTGYTVHDAAGTLLRYFLTLPEPLVPLDFYDKFRAPMNSAVVIGSSEDTVWQTLVKQSLVKQYQRLITELPPLNRQTFLYLLDLLAVLASLSDTNGMTTTKLAGIFHPGILAHPQHQDVPEQYGLNKLIVTFFIDHQENFLIGSDAPQ